MGIENTHTIIIGVINITPGERLGYEYSLRVVATGSRYRTSRRFSISMSPPGWSSYLISARSIWSSWLILLTYLPTRTHYTSHPYLFSWLISDLVVPQLISDLQSDWLISDLFICLPTYFWLILLTYSLDRTHTTHLFILLIHNWLKVSLGRRILATASAFRTHITLIESLALI